MGLGVISSKLVGVSGDCFLELTIFCYNVNVWDAFQKKKKPTPYRNGVVRFKVNYIPFGCPVVEPNLTRIVRTGMT
jgi:hypothetical protein